MHLLSQEHLDRLPAPKAIDPQRVAAILHKYMPEYTLHFPQETGRRIGDPR